MGKTKGNQDPRYEKAAQLQSKYGKIVESSIEDYYKFCFTLEVTTSRRFRFLIDRIGGDTTLIYRFDPLQTSWTELMVMATANTEIKMLEKKPQNSAGK